MTARVRAQYHDPTGAHHGGMPTYMWHCAPAGLATLRQLRAQGLRPGGQNIAAQIMWRGIGGTRAAYLYEVARAVPKRTATARQREAIRAALEARRVCPSCHVLRGYYIPRGLGECLTCAGLVVRAPRLRTRAGRLMKRAEAALCVRCDVTPPAGPRPALTGGGVR